MHTSTFPTQSADSTRVSIAFSAWNAAMDAHLRAEQPELLLQMAQVALRYLPRTLGLYQRLLRAIWELKRWTEGDEWGRRLLQADPANAVAWRAIARAAEQRGNRKEANSIWRRAFECDPYDPEIRAGLQRTTLRNESALDLTLACLGSTYLRCQRWEPAIEIYRELASADPQRVDFQSGLLIALWQYGVRDESLQLAHQLRADYPYLLLAWVVLDNIGDETDRSLAYSPLSTMDADGDYVQNWWKLNYEARGVQLRMTLEEAMLLEVVRKP